jgi:lipopolysaccharide transport system ATP-binding protein
MMTDYAIRVDNISKCYRIGGKQESYRTLQESLMGWVKAPLRRLGGQASRIKGESIIWALRDVFCEIKHGEAIGIVGRNGAGKSTLLKVLSRITKPTSGYVYLRGRVGSLLEVGTGFHPELTGRENIYLNGAILGMRRSEIEQKFDAIVDFAEIDQFLDTPVKRYSSGMYTRLAFSVAAHLEPEILLVDEVLAVGDIAFQKKCLGKMDEVARQGRTVLFVSHNLAAVQQLCNRGILLHQGRVVYQGSMLQVVQQYIGFIENHGRSVIITPADHVTGSNGIQVLRATMENGVGDSFMVPWKQPIHISIDIQAIKPFQNVSFGIGIMTIEGVAVMTVHDTDYDGMPTSLIPGRYHIDVMLDNPLRVGVYNLILGAHDAVSRSSIFYIPNAIRLEVTHPLSNEDDYHENNTGIINGSSEWVVKKVQAS